MKNAVILVLLVALAVTGFFLYRRKNDASPAVLTVNRNAKPVCTLQADHRWIIVPGAKWWDCTQGLFDGYLEYRAQVERRQALPELHPSLALPKHPPKP